MARKQRQQVTAEGFLEGYIEALTRDRHASARWQSRKDWSDKQWTSIATRAIKAAVRSSYRKQGLAVDVAIRNDPDFYGQSEYFGIDAVGHLSDWNYPLITVEHENGFGEAMQYALWKLLCVSADLRILICYVDSSRRHSRWESSVNALKGGLHEVSKPHRGKKVALIVGEWEADPSTPIGWRKVYSFNRL